MNCVYGINSCLAALQQKSFYTKEVLLQESRDDQRIKQVLDEIIKNNIPRRFVDRQTLDNISQGGNHQGVVVLFKPQKSISEVELLEYCANAHEPLLLLVLDQIVDPHNLGACIRTAEAAGVSAVISSTRKSVSLTPVVYKVACGAAERVPVVFVNNLARYLKELKQLGIWVYGAHVEAESFIYEADMQRSTALIIGAEGSGMRRLTADVCDQLYKLPMQGQMASLNASVAAGICLFEAVRQRNIQS